MNAYTLPNGATVVLDFGHNPEGVRQVGRAVFGWEGSRRVLLVGQAGDRTDQDLVDLATVVAELAPDEVMLKQMDPYLRGREPGEVVGRLRTGLVQAGYPAEQITWAPNELAGVARLLEQSDQGDLLLLLVQVDLDTVVAQLGSLGAQPL